MTHTRRLTLLAAASLAVAASCADDHPLAPAEIAGRVYVLERSGDLRPPILLSGTVGDTTQLVLESLEFGPPPRVTRSATYRYRIGSDAPRIETYRGDMEYRIVGSQVEIGSFVPCPPNALSDCAPNLVGTISADALVLAPKSEARVAPSVYRRAVLVD